MTDKVRVTLYETEGNQRSYGFLSATQTTQGDYEMKSLEVQDIIEQISYSENYPAFAYAPDGELRVKVSET